MENLCIIFDLDGTLLDSIADIALAVNLTRRDYGMPPLPDSKIRGFVGEGVRPLIDRSIPGIPDRQGALDTFIDHYRNHQVDNTRPFPGVEAGLQALTDGHFTLAVLSNKPGDICRSILSDLNMDFFFKLVLGGDEVEGKKPEPAGIIRILNDLSIPEGRAWMVGDHWTDLSAGKRAGIPCAFVTYGLGHKAMESSHMDFQSFPDLVRFFLDMIADHSNMPR